VYFYCSLRVDVLAFSPSVRGRRICTEISGKAVSLAVSLSASSLAVGRGSPRRGFLLAGVESGAASNTIPAAANADADGSVFDNRNHHNAVEYDNTPLRLFPSRLVPLKDSTSLKALHLRSFTPFTPTVNWTSRQIDHHR
jgi:hypothetical protein